MKNVFKKVFIAEKGVDVGNAAWEKQGVGGEAGARPKPRSGAGPAPTSGRTKGGRTCGGAGAWGGRRARTWVSAASSAAPSAAPAAAKMARSEDADRPMSHGGAPPELLPGQVRPGRPRRREEGAGGLGREL